jgi:hypothetical protein
VRQTIQSQRAASRRVKYCTYQLGYIVVLRTRRTDICPTAKTRREEGADWDKDTGQAADRPEAVAVLCIYTSSRCRTPHRLRIFWALAPTETSKCRGFTAHAAEQVEDHAATLLPRAASQTTNTSITLGCTDAFVWFVPRLGLESLVSVDRHRQHSTSLGPFNYSVGPWKICHGDSQPSESEVPRIPNNQNLKFLAVWPVRLHLYLIVRSEPDLVFQLSDLSWAPHFRRRPSLRSHGNI